MAMWSRMILDAAGFDAELARVRDDLLPPDLAETGSMPQHILATCCVPNLHRGIVRCTCQARPVWTEGQPV